MKNIKARDIMTKKLVTLKANQDVFDAIDALLRNDISGAPVLDSNDDFVGVFSEKNCMSVLITGTYHGLPSAEVASFVEKEPKVITEQTGILDIGQIFLRSPIRRLPVLRDGKLVGQVSRRDVLRAISENRKKITRPSSKASAPLYLSAIKESSEDVAI